MIETFDEQRELKKLQDRVIRLEAEMLIMRQEMEKLKAMCNKVPTLEAKINVMPSNAEVYEAIDHLYNIEHSFQKIKEAFN